MDFLRVRRFHRRFPENDPIAGLLVRGDVNILVAASRLHDGDHTGALRVLPGCFQC